MDFFTQSALGADAKAVADDQHAHHEFGINGWTSCVAVELTEVATQVAQV